MHSQYFCVTTRLHQINLKLIKKLKSVILICNLLLNFHYLSLSLDDRCLYNTTINQSQFIFISSPHKASIHFSRHVYANKLFCIRDILLLI